MKTQFKLTKIQKEENYAVFVTTNWKQECAFSVSQASDGSLTIGDCSNKKHLSEIERDDLLALAHRIFEQEK